MRFDLIPKATIWAIFLLFSALITYLAFYNAPSLWDDYCFALTARDYGFWAAQKIYYLGWTGRYFSTFLFHLNPLLFSDSRVPFIIFPILFNFCFVLNVYHFIKQFFKKFVVIISIALCVLYYLNSPSLLEALYWYTGTYTFLSGNLIILFLALLKKYNNSSKGFARLAVLLFLYFCIIGSSEISMVLFTGGLGCLVLFSLLKHKKINLELVLFSVVTIIGDCIVMFSPGNGIRVTNKKPIVETLIDAVPISFEHFLKWTIFSPSLILFTFAYVLYCAKFKPFKNGNRFYLTGLTVIFGLLFIATFLPSSYGMEGETPFRIQNLIYFYFLIGWFYIFGIIFSKLNFEISITINRIVTLVLTVGFILTCYKNTNLKEMINDIRYGRADSFLSEHVKRIEILKSSNEKVVFLPSIKSSPFTLHTGSEIRKDPEYLWNKCLAGYYNKEKIFLEN